MTQTYDVVLDAPLGQRFGSLTLRGPDDNITGTFSLLGFENPVRGRYSGQELELTHELRTALSTLSCETHVKLCGDELFGVVRSRYTLMHLRGKKQEEGHEK